MVQIIKWQKYLIISAALIVLNLFLALSPFLQFLWGAFYLIFFSLVFGSWLFIKQTITCKLFLGLLFVLSLASLIGTVGFYLFKLNDLTFQITLFLLPLLLLPLIIKKPLILEWPQKIWQAVNLKNVLVALIYLILILTFFYLLFSSQTGQSIRSPWEVIPKEIFFIYFMATLALFSFIIFSKSNKSLILIVIHFFASFCVALIVYQIGFDYDPFIHRTNENLILNSGTLLPKPFYYIGQYSLIFA